MKKAFLAALALSASLGAATSAQAATYVVNGNFGGTLFGQPFSTSNTQATFTGTGPDKGVRFGVDGSASYTLTSLTALSGGVTYTFTDSNLKFFTNATGTVAGFRINPTDILFSFDTGTGNLVQGTTGTANSAGFALTNGTNNGFVSINAVSGASIPVPAAAAVPEPATWAMMLAGFGMVGLGLRSRKRQSVRVTYA